MDEHVTMASLSCTLVVALNVSERVNHGLTTFTVPFWGRSATTACATRSVSQSATRTRCNPDATHATHRCCDLHERALVLGVCSSTDRPDLVPSEAVIDYPSGALTRHASAAAPVTSSESKPAPVTSGPTRAPAATSPGTCAHAKRRRSAPPTRVVRPFHLTGSSKAGASSQERVPHHVWQAHPHTARERNLRHERRVGAGLIHVWPVGL